MYEIYQLCADGRIRFIYATSSASIMQTMLAKSFADNLGYKAIRLTESENRHYYL